MGRKLEQTRIVTFKEDYAPGKSGKVIYKKDEPQAMHFTLAEKLKSKGIKMDIKEFDEKKETANAKKEFEAAKKEGKA